MKKRTMREEDSKKSRSTAAINRERAMQGDRRFKLAMLHARRWNREKFALGVDKRHGTEQPIYVGLRALTARSSSAIAEF